MSIETSANSRAGRVAVPAKITSSMPSPRSDFGLPSPITQRMASSRLDLPQPLGPTTPVRPGSILSSVGSTKLLNPLSFSRRIFTCAGPLTASLSADRLLELGLERRPDLLFGHRPKLDHLAVDDEGRSALEVWILGGGVVVHLDQLVDGRLVGQAGRALRSRDTPHRRPFLE